MGWIYYVIKEMLGYLSENSHYVHLSDGGHFENLGLYELVRRRCPCIIISDAGADPNFEFQDLTRVCRLVKADFGAEIEINSNEIKSEKSKTLADRAWITGRIRYKEDREKISKLIYIKTAITDTTKLPEEVRGYHQKHPQFPDQSTTNQFFSEAQFEAYRELGYRIAESIFVGWDGLDINPLFDCPHEQKSFCPLW